MSIIFVVLHYQNIEDTKNCISSIQSLQINKKQQIKIIIVDNKSPNYSGQELKNIYEKNKQIEVILLDKNYGFSYANNIGYQKAKKMNPNYIIMSNNDIIIEDSKFLLKLEEVFQKNSQVAVIGPDIQNRLSQHQNPLRKEILSLKKAYKLLFQQFVYKNLFIIPGINQLFCNWEEKRMEKWLSKYYEAERTLNFNEFFVPFGAFIIYTQNWIINEEVAFPSDTFMYLEEDFLGYYIKAKKHKILYSSQLIVRHLEGQSVQKSGKTKWRSMAFKSKHMYQALKKYIFFLKKERK